MTQKDNHTISYADAGVSIDAGNKLVEHIKPLAAATRRAGSVDGLGGFGGLFDLKACGYQDPILVSATDGVGTKLKLAFDANIHNTVGIDLVAMCVNDLIVQGAEPLFFLDYFACGQLSIEQARDVIAGISEGCKQAGCQLVGGETAEMPGMYDAGEYDLAGFAVGAVEREHILPRSESLNAGDVLIGLSSSGLHSNGFSLARKLLEELGMSLKAPCPFADGKTIGEALLEPTKIYINSCLPAIREGSIKALAHITGGGLIENLPRVLPDHLTAEIDVSSWQQPLVFEWIRSTQKIDQQEMLRTFNCGIGMVLVCDAQLANNVLEVMTKAGEKASIIGHLSERSGNPVILSGQFS